ncbi:MAG TPA: nucleotidyltransferase family protein [Candidatus Baltobacteraceae bacterium]|nr:nucleotidyltransferase family protein [Candidatus Baltobacteraceae bacterium]
MDFRAVILAAGESKRMGAQKLLMPYRGRPMIEHALEAAQRWKPLVVAGAQVAAHLRAMNADVLLNHAPRRGMTHSLALANAHIPSDAALIVLLGDKPLVTPQLIAQIADALADGDAIFPVHPQTREPGHPVIFSPRARAKIPLLPDGDALRALRDDPELVRREIATEDRGAYFDIDTVDSIA